MRMERMGALGIAMLLIGCGARDAEAPAATVGTPSKAAGTEAPAAAAPRPPELRLPGTIRPTRYEVTLTVVPDENRFEGRISIPLELRAASDVVWLNAAKLDVRTATIDGAPASVLAGGDDFVGIRPARPLAAGHATLVLDYAGIIDGQEQSTLFKEKDGEAWYAFTDFEPIGARHVFPCFDEPSFKVPWKLRLKVRPGDRAFANAPQSSETAEGNYKIVEFEETKPLPSYLVAFAVGPFDTVDAAPAGKNKVPVRIIVPHGRGAEARYAKEVTSEALNRLEDYFGIPYPYAKVDILDVPAFAGAMENPGLVTFAEPILLTPPDKESVHFQRRYTGVVTHELAHQWFGDLVTTAWWDDLWLNEGFADWTMNRVIGDWKPDWYQDAARASDTADAMREDGLLSARRIRQPITSNGDMLNAFDSITYAKSAAVINMFENSVGRERFRAGVRRYLTKYAFGNASSEQFLSAVFEGAQAGQVIPAFRTFLNQPGVPLVTATLKCEAGKAPSLSLTQERYLPAGSEGKTDAGWGIPVCARYPVEKGPVEKGPVEKGPGKEKGIARSCTLLDHAQGDLPLGDAASCPSWVDANADANGYYRVLYGGDLLGKLLSPATHDGKDLTRGERVSLLSDLSALVRTSKLSYADVLRVVPKLAGDPVSEVVIATVDTMVELQETGLVPEPLRPKYARFVRDVYGARAKKLGFAPHSGEDDDTRLVRAPLLLLVADQGEDGALQQQAKALALGWLRDRKGVDPSVLDVVLTIAAENGDRGLFDRMVAAARSATVRADRTKILEAMGSFRDPELLKASLGLLLDGPFDEHETFWMVQRAQTSEATRQIVYDFVKQNYDPLSKRLTEDSTPRRAMVPVLVGRHFCDDAHAADLASFFHDRNPEATGGPRLLAQTVEQVKLCSAYRSIQAPNVAAFFQKGR